MFTPPPTPPRLSIPPDARPTLRVLPVGHTLDATVARDANGQLALLAGRMRLPLPTGTGLQAGDTATLRVTGSGGQRGLEVLARRPAETDSVTRLQRLHLPRQRPVTESLNAVRTVAETGRLPPPVARAVDTTLAALPQPAQLTSADGLRQALRDSGTLFESLITAAPESAKEIAGRDLRAKLMQLAARLRTSRSDGTDASPARGGNVPGSDALATARDAVDGALSRQLLNQLHARTPDGHVQLAFELPLRHGEGLDDLRLEIREESGSGHGGEQTTSASWSVTVHLTFAGLGEVEARLYYTAEGLAVTWSASTDRLRERVAAELPELAHALEQADIPVHGLRVSQVPPTARTDDNHPPTGLIDDQA
ncbi:flagellar hook-length control protein FliK [Arhodomonas sp. AD133]|uniref:flagellar hook-length control protein FliK n=1 Tax=Arhodomonas sp. AD133 TaxID=3415009 RepID=UPI003EBC3F99